MKFNISLTKPQLLEFLIHIVSWLLIFGFPLLFIERENIPNIWTFYLRHFRAPLAFAIVFYCNYAFLIPRYQLKKHPKKYYLCNIVLILATGLLLHLSQNWTHYRMDMGNIQPPHITQNRPLQTDSLPFPQFRERNDSLARPVIQPNGYKPPSWSVPPRWSFFLRDIILLSFIAGLAVAIRTSREWRKMKEAQRDAELTNLRNQLNPHFLLNTLNNIYALTAFDTDKAQQAIQELSRLLRHLLYDNLEKFVSLKQEADFIHSYVELMRIRLPKEVTLEMEIDILPDSQTQIAPLIFISLIENAFKHGISPTGPSFISIHLSEKEGYVRCSIVNSNHPKNNSDKSGSGIGLTQVRRRLELIYPDSHKWEKGVTEDRMNYYSTILIHTRKK